MSDQLGNINPQTEVAEKTDIDSLQAQIDAVVPANQLLSGGVTYNSGLTFDVSALEYRIDGIVYMTAATQVTLGIADPINDRIDVIAATSSGTVIVIAGTPAVNPVKPEVDPATQLELTFVTVAAAQTTPDISIENIYLENAEWAATTNAPARINVASNVDPFEGTLAIEATNAVNNDRVNLAKGADYEINTQSVLQFRIKLKAAIGNNERIRLRFRKGGVNIGVNVDVRNGRYGFDRNNAIDYQAISVPISEFKVGSEVDELRMIANNISTSVGFFIDRVRVIEGFGIAVGVDAEDVMYDPGAPANWENLPANVKAALDELARPKWHLTSLTLGDAQASAGITVFNAPAGGYLFTTPEGESLRWNISLDRNGIAYDGSSLRVILHYQLFSAPGASDQAQISGDVLFASDGDDNYNDPGSVAVGPSNWALNGIPAREQQSQNLFVISGPAGAKMLQITLTRDNLAPAVDYAGDFDIYGITIEKV